MDALLELGPERVSTPRPKTKGKRTASGSARTRAVRLLLCDDQRLIRMRLQLLFHDLASVEVVGEAATGREAIRLARELKPDLIIMDVSMPDLDGIEATRQIAAQSAGVRVLAYSGNDDAESLRKMFAAGASGYVLKTSDPTQLLTAIQSVLNGRRFIGAQSMQPRICFRHD